MWIKICANTNLEDAQMAVAMGADAVGFVFAASRRQMTPAEVGEITAHLPGGVERIGVFDVQGAPEIASTVARAGLTGVQLHGPLDPEVVTGLTRELAPGICVIQTVAWAVGERNGEAAQQVARQMQQIDRFPAIGRVLVDSRIGPVSGGTGVPFGWSEAAEVLRAGRDRAGLIVAGGLRPENVAAAITTLRPWGVDVATGVEQSPGKKDPAKIRMFVENARVAAESGGGGG